MKIPNFSLKTKIAIIVGVTVLIINSVVAHQIWVELREFNRNVSQEKLVAIARSTASQIDLKRHEKIKSVEDAESQEYLKIQSTLQKIMEANPGIDDIYTMRKTDDPDIWQFVAGANETADDDGDGMIEENEMGVEIGEEYEISQFSEMKKAFDLPIADEIINCDKWGCFLSGYAPIRDETGNALAIVGVDMLADDLTAYENQARLVVDILALTLSIFYPLVIYVLLRMIIRPVFSIIESLRRFSDNLSERIKVRSGDEFGKIAETFNHMADEIQSLYSGMEKKVEEKTLDLSYKMKEIQQRKAEDDALLSSIGEGMVATDWNGRIIAINKVAEKMLGCSAEKIIGTDCTEWFKIETLEGKPVRDEERPSHEVIVSKQMVSRRYNFITKEGKIPIFVTASPVIIKGKAVGSIMVVRDITKEVEIDRAKSEFVSLASHQLRTPLTTMNWYLELVSDDPSLPEKHKNNLKEIYTANQRLIGLVGDLLNVSRLELGKFIVRKTNFRIEELIDSVFKELIPNIIAKKLKIEKKFPIEKIFLSSDEKLVRIILQNIITNAVKYTPPQGSVAASVKLIKKKKGENSDWVEVKVADTGYGIPTEQQQFIFTKLFRADNVKQRETDGNGLGMYIAKSFVEKLGGSISFVSRENKGTTFTILLPLKSSAVEEMKKESNSV